MGVVVGSFALFGVGTFVGCIVAAFMGALDGSFVLFGAATGVLVGTFTGKVGDFDGIFVCSVVGTGWTVVGTGADIGTGNGVGTITGTGTGPVTESGTSVGTGAATGVATGRGGIPDGAMMATGDWVGISDDNGLGTVSDDGDCGSILPHPPQSNWDDSK